MSFLNPLPLFFWLIPLIPILIFLINRRKYQLVEFSTIRFFINLKRSEINKIRLLNILLLIIRTMILIIILIIIMRPEINSINLPVNISNSKISNIILVDDSFSNKYGKVFEIERKQFIEDIIISICENYPIESNLKVIDLDKGPIFDGFNDQNFSYQSINGQNREDIENSDFLNDGGNFEFKNLHIISNSNKSSIEKNKNIYEYINDKDNLAVFYHYLPESSNNQYISNIKLIGSSDGFFDYKIETGNDYKENVDLILSANQNLYNYNNSSLFIAQTAPILNKSIQIDSKSSRIDTISIQLEPNHFMEILFKLEKKENNLIVNLLDDRVEDNTYSYIMDLPDNINATVYYNNKQSIKYMKPALDAFKLITTNIDSNFLNIEYMYSEGIKKYSNTINDQDILIFLGYDIFVKSDRSIFSKFLYNENSQILIFPTKNDIINDSYVFSINDSLTIQNSYKENHLISYDTLEFIENRYSIIDELYSNNFKLNNYFFHQSNKNTIFKIDKNRSIWSRYNIGNGHLDLFGFLIDYGNNFFSSEITYSIPLLYSIIINEKINSIKNNLILNEKFNIFNKTFNKLKFINTDNDSIIWYSSQNPVIYSKNLKALIHNEKLIDLYSFNPSMKNFNNNIKLDEISFGSKFKLITYNQSNYKESFSSILYKNEISIYFIYFLIFLLLIEIYLSNGKSSKSS